MPTPDGQRSVQDALDEGIPFVDASGIKRKVYHQGGCTGETFGRNVCQCRLDSRLRRLAMEMADLMQEYQPRRDKTDG